jgi:long-chain acyl-CoA synthetase
VGALTGREPAGSLARLLAWRLQEAPDRGFLFVEHEGPWTFSQLAASAAAPSRRLDDVGLDDRVVLRTGNDERFLPAAAAVWSRQAAVVPMHPAAPVEEVARVVAALDVRAAICDPTDPAAAALPVPTVGFDRFPAVDTPGTAALAESFVAPPAGVGGRAAVVLLTSGTTGEPKGVVLTHDNAWANLAAMVSAFRTESGPTPLAPETKPPNLVANPLSHTAGVIRILHGLYVGRRVALLRKFDGRTTKQLIDRHRIDNLTINPTMLRILLDSLEQGEDLGAVRYVASGTAPLTPALREEFEARFGIPVLQAYGQTEAFGAVSIESARDVMSGRRRPGSVGRPLPGVQLKIVLPTGNEAPTGQSGEIRLRARAVCSGYLGTDQSSPLDGDGWLRTGDLGRIDEDGYLFVTGRIKNVIICGGFNVVPEEVEAALAEDPAVRESVVLGMPDERLGEIPVAVVASLADAHAVEERLRPRLAPFKRPRRVFVVDELPKVANGKVDRVAALALATRFDGIGDPTR